MNNLVVPKVIRKGDTIALISISGGRAGDEDIPEFDDDEVEEEDDEE